MNIDLIIQNKKVYLDLLLLGDESEKMIDRYLERGDMYILKADDSVVGVCVVTDEGDGVLEIKNIAIKESQQRKGYGRSLVKFIQQRYTTTHNQIVVGTGETPSTLNFYEKCGFIYSHRIENFFIDNYFPPIIEEGTTLIDMVYLKMSP